MDSTVTQTNVSVLQPTLVFLTSFSWMLLSWRSCTSSPPSFTLHKLCPHASSLDIASSHPLLMFHLVGRAVEHRKQRDEQGALELQELERSISSQAECESIFRFIHPPYRDSAVGQVFFYFLAIENEMQEKGSHKKEQWILQLQWLN